MVTAADPRCCQQWLPSTKRHAEQACPQPGKCKYTKAGQVGYCSSKRTSCLQNRACMQPGVSPSCPGYLIYTSSTMSTLPFLQPSRTMHSARSSKGPLKMGFNPH